MVFSTTASEFAKTAPGMGEPPRKSSGLAWTAGWHWCRLRFPDRGEPSQHVRIRGPNGSEELGKVLDDQGLGPHVDPGEEGRVDNIELCLSAWPRAARAAEEDEVVEGSQQGLREDRLERGRGPPLGLTISTSASGTRRMTSSPSTTSSASSWLRRSRPKIRSAPK